MRILRASHLGMCFGVRDAIDLALRHADTAPLTILGDLVHNDAVLARLRSRGIVSASDPLRATTATVMVTAHGASNRSMARTRALGVDVVDATCPLVHVAHRAVQALVRDGYHPIIIGQRGHVEVRGITEDLEAFDVVLDEADVEALAPRPRLGIAAQTTQPIDKVRGLVARIRARFSESDVHFIDTVCRPTKQRQAAAIDLAREADLVVVVGGASSNNTRQLVDTCMLHCARVHHVQTDGDLCSEWFRDVETVGLTAGTSTPDDVVDLVESRIRSFAHVRSAAAGTRHGAAF
jgi:4-hydroxy-3-methylbut-2-enyl diphosphate reductase